MSQDFKFELGEEVMDKITQFHGIITSRTQWLTNCNTYSVQSRELNEGKPIERQWFDEPMLERVSEKVRQTEFDFERKKTDKPGGPVCKITPTNRI
jgi:hypothetical protein